MTALLRSQRFWVRVAAAVAVSLAGTVAVGPSSLSANALAWVVVAGAAVAAAAEGRAATVGALPWVVIAGSVMPATVAVVDPERVWNVAAAGLLMWAGAEAMALARTLARLGHAPDGLVAARLDAMAPVALGGAAAALGIVAVATVEPAGGVVIVGAGVLAAIVYAAVARAVRGD